MNKQQETKQELNVAELETVTGGEAAQCTYADKTYSEGSVLDMPGGSRECKSDGKWH